MLRDRSDIIHELQREILALGGIPAPLQGTELPDGLEELKGHFPHGALPTGAIHEFLGSSLEDGAASAGFIAALLSSCLPHPGAVAWISSERTVYPPALSNFRMEPHHILFIQPTHEKDLLWATEEALKCQGLRAVITEMKDLQSKHSRRFQLAVESSGVTGFILNRSQGTLSANHCVSRWKVTALPSQVLHDMPGVGHPNWDVELLKIRNGKPGRWHLYWTGDTLQPSHKAAATMPEELDHKLTG